MRKKWFFFVQQEEKREYHRRSARESDDDSTRHAALFHERVDAAQRLPILLDDDVAVDDGQAVVVDLVVELVEQGALKRVDVINDVVDDLHLGDFAVLGHVGHQFAEFGEVQLHLLLLCCRRFAYFAVRHSVAAGWGGHWTADGRGSFHHFFKVSRESLREREIFVFALVSRTEQLRVKFPVMTGPLLYRWWRRERGGPSPSAAVVRAPTGGLTKGDFGWNPTTYGALSDTAASSNSTQKGVEIKQQQRLPFPCHLSYDISQNIVDCAINRSLWEKKKKQPPSKFFFFLVSPTVLLKKEKQMVGLETCVPSRCG